MEDRTLSNSASVALVERLFSRFVSLYGSQKVGSMWADADLSEVKALWAQQLTRYKPATIGLALQNLMASGNEWPPTLPEFMEMCRQASIAREQHSPAVMLPAQRARPEVVRSHIEQVTSAVSKRRGSRDWARKIIARHESGEHLAMAVLGMARAALNMAEESMDEAAA